MSLTEVQFTGATVEQAPGRAIQGRSPWQLAWRRLRSDRVAVASAIIIVLLCLVALAAPLIASLIGHPPAIQYPYGTTDQGLPKPPGAGSSCLAPTTSAVTCSSGLSTVPASHCWLACPPRSSQPCSASRSGLSAGYYGGWSSTGCLRGARTWCSRSPTWSSLSRL